MKQKLIDSFQKELEFSTKNIDRGHLDIAFQSVAEHLAKLNFTKCVVEIVANGKLKFHLVFPEEHLLMITKPIYPDEYSVEANEVFVSLFIKQKPIVTNLFEIEKFVESFNIFLDL